MTEVRGRLEQSLHNSVWLALGLERQDYQVQRPWSATVSQGAKRAVPLDAGTRIVEVFDRPDLQKQLLILGEPGAGKTTMMLELAEDLGRRAGADNGQPIPVLVSLSSWKDPKQSIFEWLVGELKAKYGLRVELGREWLRLGRLLPLLDGLDEVATERQRDCAVALNGWLTGDVEQRPCGVLICCRREEFEQVVREPLSLYGAIYLPALTVGQIEDYFVRFGLGDVWETVSEDGALRELLMTPLFLSMFGLVQVQGTFDLAGWQARETSERRIEYLFDMYWEAAMSRRLIVDPNQVKQGIQSNTYQLKAPPSRIQVRRSLVFAAKMLDRKEVGTELLIEKIQPTALVTESQKWVYRIVEGFFEGLIVALFVSLIYVLFFGLIDNLFNVLIRGSVIGACSGAFFGIGSIVPIEIFETSRPRVVGRNILKSISINLIGGAIGSVIACLLGSLFFGVIGSLIGGLICGLIYGLICDLMTSLKADIQTSIEPNQGIKNVVKNTLIVMSIALISAVLLKLLLEHPLLKPVDSEDIPRLIISLFACLVCLSFREGGARDVCQHVALRIVLAANRYAPLRYDLLLNYCTERLLLQRIGGRYRFMHKTLQDYFAKQEL